MILALVIAAVLVVVAVALVTGRRARPPVPPARPRTLAALDDTGDQVQATVFPIRRVPPDGPPAA